MAFVGKVIPMNIHASDDSDRARIIGQDSTLRIRISGTSQMFGWLCQHHLCGVLYLLKASRQSHLSSTYFQHSTDWLTSWVTGSRGEMFPPECCAHDISIGDNYPGCWCLARPGPDTDIYNHPHHHGGVMDLIRGWMCALIKMIFQHKI